MTLWSVPEDSPLETDRLRMIIEIYEESILMRSLDRDTSFIKPVSADELASLLTQTMGHSSGLLPPGTLWWSQGRNGRCIAIYKEPEVRRVAIQTRPLSAPKRMSIPMPGALFLCVPGHAPWVYASPERPRRETDMLYRMPTFNIFDDGRACQGSHSFPDRAELIPDSFFASYFSLTGATHNRSVKYPYDLLKLWTELDGQKTYPNSDLVEQFSVEEAIAVSRGIPKS